ncbi:small glutamine-rich tetratricopeptide repeat-containing protein alpha-like [Eriocheir sinensis]|uniref:small glutamine-rich tetratricopeptide repeat-containing protein alpha-like n=1 Tax=Eriocheir sinensis TaxID=95602 RepID=UPI0021C5E06B|nr:small glutamine-rich tetratricopeptide repeat-containing protein alpha-like [Eriocheir sinensis]XP_050708419.1 small glutamine-rich tetratricopeptide repeat-containing protein alpha-like [Eriocheir sinensis]
MEKEVVNRLVYSMIQFLQSQLEGGGSSGGLTEEGVESVEVAIQCLETAYGVSLSQTEQAVSRPLYQIFAEAVKGEPSVERAAQPQQMDAAPPREATEEEKGEAEKLKNEGNQLMRDERFTEALDCYTRAISKDSQNAVYYCNRAAAHSKLNNQREAIEDCKRALQIEPQYSKAYGRMGLAYSSLSEHHRAKECYQKALELEPENDSYRSNLAIAEEKLQAEPQQQQQQPGNAFGGFGPGGLPFGLGGLGNLAGAGGPDLGNILGNPALMNMATQLMADPNMQNMLSNFMGVMAGGGGPGGGVPGVPPPNVAPPPPPPPVAPPVPPPGGPGGPGGMEALLNVGRQLAEQMQSQHPELVEQIRQQMNRGGGAGGGGGGGGGDQGGEGGNQDPPPQT